MVVLYYPRLISKSAHVDLGGQGFLQSPMPNNSANSAWICIVSGLGVGKWSCCSKLYSCPIFNMSNNVCAISYIYT